MNIFISLAFFILAAYILGAAVMVVTVRNIVHAALWLISTFFAVGALYLLLEAEFIGVAQVLIYVGATSILILFAIMLTRDLEGSQNRQLNRRWWTALIVPAALFGLLLVPTALTHEWNTVPPPAPGAEATPIATAPQIGTAFMREYLLPFEAASVLLLVALIGAIVVAYDERERRRRVLTLAEEVRLRNRRRPPVPELGQPAAPSQTAQAIETAE